MYRHGDDLQHGSRSWCYDLSLPFVPSMASYLHATGRGPVAEAALNHAQFLQADAGAVYDRVIEINLSTLEPHINGPFTPDLATPLSKFAGVVRQHGWKDEVKVGLIGSCTNSSYEDMDRVTSLAKQAVEKGIKSKAGFFITPGSEQIRATIERDGQSGVLEKVGGVVLANACGPCIGQVSAFEPVLPRFLKALYRAVSNILLPVFNSGRAMI